MKVIPSTKIWYFDVDGTLVNSFMLTPEANENEHIEFGGRKFIWHHRHRQLILDLLARGHTVVIWSAGGWEWAQQVAEALFTEEERATSRLIVCSKPDGYCDDKKVDQWLGETDYFFIEEEGFKKSI